MDRDAAARRFLGASWEAIEADCGSWIAKGEAAVLAWRWVAWSETMWERPLAMSGEEEPMRFLASEPRLEDRHKAVLRGFDEAGNAVAARYFHDHWMGSTEGTQPGVVMVEVVWVGSVMLLFSHLRHGTDHHRVHLGTIEHVIRDRAGHVMETASWGGDNRYPNSWRCRYERCQDGRPTRQVRESFEGGIDEAGELRKVAVADYDYDAEGLVRVRWTTTFARHFEAGDSVVTWFRRSEKAVRAARKLVNAELPKRITEWARRVAPSEPVYALGLVWSFDAPTLPPAVGLGTLSELRAWRQQNDDEWSFRTSAWSPAEYRIFDGIPPELVNDPALNDAYALLNQDWQASQTEREPRATLLRCARTLIAQDWTDTVVPADDFVVFVVADELDDDLKRHLRSTISSDALRRLESRPSDSP